MMQKRISGWVWLLTISDNDTEELMILMYVKIPWYSEKRQMVLKQIQLLLAWEFYIDVLSSQIVDTDHYLDRSSAWSSEKAMAPHSSTLAWKIPWTEEPGRLQSMGLLRVGHDWATSLSLFTVIHWRRKWQPTPVFLPGESQGWWSLVGWRLWGRTESDTTEMT